MARKMLFYALPYLWDVIGAAMVNSTDFVDVGNCLGTPFLEHPVPVWQLRPGCL